MLRRLLLIDDDDDIREVAALSLQATTSWTILTAASGPQGLALAAAEAPDAILMDVQMPGMDGPTTFGHLQSNPATAAIPVILLTAKVHGPDHRRLAALGVAAILAKPFDPLTLAVQITQALHWQD